MFKFLEEKVSYIKNEHFYSELSRLKGYVLEIGFGDGESFAHYSSDCQIFALEKTEKKIRKYQNRIDQNKQITTFKGIVEDLPFKSNVFDSIVVSFVLCSVKSVEKAISEIERVLKPGGRFVMLEHTKCENWVVGKLQDFFATPYSWVINNCHPNRNPLQVLLKHHFDISAKIQHSLLFSHLQFAIALKRG